MFERTGAVAGDRSYPRTESEYLPEGQAGDAAAIVAAITTVLTDLRDIIPGGEALLIRSGVKGHYVKDPGEHHAIVPLRKVPERGRLSADQFRLWELVAKAYLTAHLPGGIDARTSVTAEVGIALGPKRFAVSGSVIRAQGVARGLRQ
ncbi:MULTISPECIES: DNA topoisomerase [unclassified Methylobacterium]|uniref:DNA topoisomerase n=1 Tax=unclassified Methylobacterium TaxID=2615210 RepID=UPI002269BA62